MRTTCLFFSLLLAINVHAQPSPINRRAMVISGLAKSSDFNAILPAGIWFRWKSSDLSTTPVSDWVDEIQGYHWTASGSARPTLATNAVIFDGVGNWMTATNPLMSPIHSAALLVYQWVSTAADKTLFLQDSFGGGQLYFCMGDTANFIYEGQVGNNAVGPIGTSLQDFITAPSSATPHYSAWTNGVLSQWSDKAATWNNNKISHVGSDGSSFFGHFILKEAIWWTNQTTWTSTTISNVHAYATNTYPHTP